MTPASFMVSGPTSYRPEDYRTKRVRDDARNVALETTSMRMSWWQIIKVPLLCALLVGCLCLAGCA